MPLFMDLHKASDYDQKPTVEDIKRSHIADLEVQDKYGVKFLQYWINEESGMVFCLMEAPNKEACAAVHQEAHGNMPCNVIELRGGDYVAFMGNENKVNEHDIVETPAGNLDTGYRVIMVSEFISQAQPTQLQEYVPVIIKKYSGRIVLDSGNRNTSVFNTAGPAIACAREIMEQQLLHGDDQTETMIGISAGEPVTREDGFFADSIRLANRLCDIASGKQIVVSPLVKQLATGIIPDDSLKILTSAEEKFLNQLAAITEEMIAEPAFDIPALSRNAGLSKSRLYRQVKAMTGRSANDHIRETRLRKAYQMLRCKEGNVSEVAFATGFSSASYFTRSFRKRFGFSPQEVIKSASS